jgi:hypothetical protein
VTLASCARASGAARRTATKTVTSVDWEDKDFLRWQMISQWRRRIGRGPKKRAPEGARLVVFFRPEPDAHYSA